MSRRKRAIVFAVNVAHSLHITAQFVAAGVRARHLDGTTPKAEREQILADLKSGAIDVVVNVNVLTEGFDCPAVDIIILARPTKSETVYLQQVGRGMRPSPETGKTHLLILDHSGNTLRHGFPDTERDLSPTATSKRVRELHTCPCCKVIFGALRDGVCPHCNERIAMPAEPKTPGQRTERDKKIVVEGRRIDRATIERMRAERTLVGIKGELSDTALARAAVASTKEKAAEYLRLLTVAERKGFKPGFAAHKYRETFGVWPRFRDGVLDTVEPAARTVFLPHRACSMNEAVLQKLILARLSEIPGVYCWRQNVGAVQTKNGFVRFGLIGQADISGVLRGGRRLEIEVKSEMGKVRDEQKVFGQRMTEMGALYIVARSLDDVMPTVLEALR